MTVTSARPSAEAASVPSDESFRKDIPIPAKNLTADELEEPITTVVKTEGVQAEIESKLLNLPPRFNMVKSDEDRKRKLALDFIALSNNRKSQFMRQDVGGTREDNARTPFTPPAHVVHLPIPCDNCL